MVDTINEGNSLTAGASAYRRGLLLVLMAGVCWSTMGLGIRLMEAANVWQILFYRSCALVPFLFLIIGVRSRGRPMHVIRRAGVAGAAGGLSLVLAFAGGIFAIQATTVANAMFLFASAPFFAALFGHLLLGERVRNATWVSMAAASLGMAIMVAEGVSLGHAAGNAAAILSALGFAAFTIALRWRKLEDMLPAVLFSGVFAVAIAGAVCWISGYPLAIPTRDIYIALAMGVLQLGAGLFLYTIGSKSVPAVELALMSMTEVVLGPLWVWIFLGETADALTLFGGAILLAAIAGNALSGLQRKPTPVM
ncbi:MAG: DMT family transporter [Gammaproteobacteria bacterium]|nr:DMT family transporter [Gammaproteobacteria bacterium]